MYSSFSYTIPFFCLFCLVTSADKNFFNVLIIVHGKMSEKYDLPQDVEKNWTEKLKNFRRFAKHYSIKAGFH